MVKNAQNEDKRQRRQEAREERKTRLVAASDVMQERLTSQHDLPGKRIPSLAKGLRGESSPACETEVFCSVSFPVSSFNVLFSPLRSAMKLH